MAILITDTFGGSGAFTSHASDSGATVTQIGAATSGTVTLTLDNNSPGGVYVSTGSSGAPYSVYKYSPDVSGGTVVLNWTLHDYSEDGETFIAVGVGDDSGNCYYLQGWPSAFGGGWNFEKAAAGTGSSSLARQASGNLTTGHDYACSLTWHWTGTTNSFSWTVTDGGTSVWSSSTTDATYSGVNRVVFRMALGGAVSNTSTAGFHVRGLTAANPGIVLSPATVYSGSTTTITMTGYGTGFTSGTAPTASSGTVSSWSVASTTSATFSYAAPSGSAAVTITDVTDSFTATLPVWIPMSDSHVVLSPGNWVLPGDGTAWTPNPGAYFKVGLSIPSSGSVTVEVDSSALGPNATYVKSILGSATGTAQGTPADIAGSSSISVGSSLSSQTSDLKVWYAGRTQSVDAWGSSGVKPTNALIIKGIYAPGATTTAPQTFAKKMLVFGDSRVEGYDNLSNAGTAAAQDASFTHGIFLAEALGAEVGIVAYGGQGWTHGGNTNVPALSSSYNLISSGVSRSFTGLYAVLILDMGGNDYGASASASSVETAVANVLSGLRSAVPAGCWIGVVPSYEGYYSTYSGQNYIPTGFANYQSSTPDQFTFYSTLGLTADEQTMLASALNGAGGTMWSADGTHPTIAGHGLIAARLAQLVQATTATTTICAGPFGGFGASLLSF